jgi:hypothetical protein
VRLKPYRANRVVAAVSIRVRVVTSAGTIHLTA